MLGRYWREEYEAGDEADWKARVEEKGVQELIEWDDRTAVDRQVREWV